MIVACPRPRRLPESRSDARFETSPVLGANRLLEAGRADMLCPGVSDINLFRYCQRVIDLKAEIPDRAFDLGVP
jgi:hypothetical protein